MCIGVPPLSGLSVGFGSFFVRGPLLVCWRLKVVTMDGGAFGLELLRCQKKRLLKRRLLQAPQAPFKAPIHSKCCIGGFRETGLTLVIVLRCDWPLCDLRFKSYEHFKIKMSLSVHTAGPWWIFPKLHLSTFPLLYLRQCQYDHDQDEAQPVLYTNGFYPEWHSCEYFGCQCFLYKNCNVRTQMAFTQSDMYVNL